MGLIHKAVYAGAAVVAYKAYVKHEDKRTAQRQQQQPQYAPQQTRSLDQDGNYVHVSYCNGQCGGQCNHSNQTRSIQQGESADYYTNQPQESGKLPLYGEEKVSY